MCQDSSLGNIVELMVWSYVDNIDTYIDYSTWRTYSELFRGVWAASAFKGATGERQHIPDILSHVRNQIAWLQVMERESQHEVDPVKFKGLALTGQLWLVLLLQADLKVEFQTILGRNRKNFWGDWEFSRNQSNVHRAELISSGFYENSFAILSNVHKCVFGG